MFLIPFILLSISLLLYSKNLLMSLLVLEMLSFLALAQTSALSSSFSSTDILVIAFFSIFVIEGVIALSGLISLVTHTGSDSVGSSSLLKL